MNQDLRRAGVQGAAVGTAIAAANSRGRCVAALQSACAVVLIGFMIFIAFYDTGDWVRSARSNREEPMIFAPKGQ